MSASRVDAVRVSWTRHARGRCALVNVVTARAALPAFRTVARAGHVITGDGVLRVARAEIAAVLAESTRWAN